MPVIKYKDVLLHFAHIPKCGGTSVERYVAGLNDVSMAFVDQLYVAQPSEQHWNVSSTQHIDGEPSGRLFPHDFFIAFLAIVCHPMSRLESAYKHQCLREKTIGDESMDTFVKTRLADNYLTKGWMDNHFYPQSGFFYPGANYQVFKLEDSGTEHAKAFIDAVLFGNATRRDVTHSNRVSKSNGLSPEDLKLSDEARTLVYKIYAMDFDNFGYHREITHKADTQPDVQQSDMRAAG
ncbi:hypothetical protein GFB49_01985 [Epibacterium sp. SM1979]|uniref:Sulfotransferase family protein n=1 Tax=Tritonibacter litoralis TaxID=2662264 RepID=A0A843YC13_9RHOB|nr:sulfotransferase family 2 domain-containing protein [Tritonibacter litoralis]MQQ07215.1 hypothetical protein [Tritonibacter litoralis]